MGGPWTPRTLWRSLRATVRDASLASLLSGALLVQGCDVLTTYVGIYELGLAEWNPFMETLLSTAGIPGLVGVKVAWIAVTLAGGRLVDDTHQLTKYCCLLYILIGGVGVLDNLLLITALLLA